MKRSVQALGRLAPGAMNRTEAAYAAHLRVRKAAGEVAWFAFEAVTLKIAHDCRLTPDFAVMLSDGRIELHDVKGSPRIVTDDAKVKMRVAASSFPFPFFYVFPVKGGGWTIEEIKT